MGLDRSETSAQLLKDLSEARRRLAGLEELLAEKNRTEEALRETEQRYRALFEQAADHILVRRSNQ
jgi:PAS domain-containing protein